MHHVGSSLKLCKPKVSQVYALILLASHMTDSQSYKKRVNDVSGHMSVVYEIHSSMEERKRLPLGRTGWAGRLLVLCLCRYHHNR
jgi:hypothetical protein